MSTEMASPPRELAPSAVSADEPAFARIVGMAGLFATVLGGMALIVNGLGGPWTSWIPNGAAYLSLFAGIAGLLFHAGRDSDFEVRRVYGMAACLLLLAAVVVGAMPGKSGAETERVIGHFLFPWGAAAGLLSLLFFIPFARHETEEPYATGTKTLLVVVGGLLSLGAIVGGLIKPEFLVGPGVVLGLLGLGFWTAYIGLVDTSDGPGYRAAVLLGAVGGAAVVLAIGQAVMPTVLHEGPRALKNAAQVYDKWLIVARGFSIFLGLAFAFWGATGRVAPWLRGVLVVLGLAWAGAFAYGSFNAPLVTAPKPYLVPYGLILGGIGAIYLAISVGACSDNLLVVLTRREVLAYFVSPVAYFVLLMMAAASWIGFLIFADGLLSSRSVLEPILQRYWGATMGAAFGVVLLVPALTMATFAEERRTGSLEVLLTAPVNELPIVLSKFFAALFLFMLAWVPLGLYLIPLRIEGGQPFDYRPLLSYYLAMAACGSSFIGMGIFFSSLTKNQIVAAVLTFTGMFGMLLTIIVKGMDFLPNGLKVGLGKLDYFSLWQSALGGQLLVSDVLIHLSLAAFWLFLTVKVLEARKWS